MAQSFNAYLKWLGIPLHHQPPNPYRLLGIELFESDPDVIDNSADRQMAHLRTFQNGPHQAECQRILSEIAQARTTLLDPRRKAHLDAQLQAAGQTAGPSPSAANAAAPAPIVIDTQTPTAAPAPASATGNAEAENTPARAEEPSALIQGLKIAGGGVAGVVLALLILLMMGVDPLGLLKKSKPRGGDSPRIAQSPQTAPRQRPKTNPGRRKKPVVPKKPRIDTPLTPATTALTRNPFRVVSSTAASNSQATAADPFQLPLSGAAPTTIPPSQWGPRKTPPEEDRTSEATSKCLVLAGALKQIAAAGSANAAAKSQLETLMTELPELVSFHLRPDEGWRAAEAELLSALASGPSAASAELGIQAAQRLNDPPDRRAGRGVIAVGKVTAIRAVQMLFETEVQLAGAGRVAHVVTWKDPRQWLETGEVAAFIGVILDDPTATLHRYEGKRNVVVWSRWMRKLGS